MIDRRHFLTIIGWGGIVAFTGLSVYGSIRFLFPTVLYEPPTTFRLNSPESYPIGFTEAFLENAARLFINQDKALKIFLVRNERGMYALTALCRYEGCALDPVYDIKMLKCSCCGSLYDFEGNIHRGPSEQALWWLKIDQEPISGEIVVDAMVKQDITPKKVGVGYFVDRSKREAKPFFLNMLRTA